MLKLCNPKSVANLARKVSKVGVTQVRTAYGFTAEASVSDGVETTFFSRDNLIIPRFSTPVSENHSHDFEIDCGKYQNSGKLHENKQLLEEMNYKYDKTGALYLKNTGLTNLDDMRLVALKIVGEQMVYEGGANPRDYIEENVYDVGAPLSAWLQYHHEMAYVSKSTSMLSFMCNKATPGKGWTYISDNAVATRLIMETELGHKLKSKGLCYVRNLTDRDYYAGRENPDGVYNHWQHSTGTNDRDEAVDIMAARGLETRWGENGMLETRFYISAFEYCPITDSNVLFSSLADDSMWFDSWPGIMHLEPQYRPLKLTFGDDVEFTPQEKQTFIDVYDHGGIPLKWNVGDIAFMCNYRWAHGRPAIFLEPGEERQLGVILGKSFDRVQCRDDKW